MDIKNQIQKIRIIGKGHIKDSNKWREFADEIDVLLKMVNSQKSSIIDSVIERSKTEKEEQ